MSDDFQTIAALATAPGPGAIAIIRVSGPAVTKAIERHLKPANPISWKLYHCRFIQGDHEIDAVNFVYQKSPRSYTGEDCLEVYCHGNLLIVRQILEALMVEGDIVPAKAGEFTQRALENGKMDLIQAEAVGQLAMARTQAAVHNAQKQLQGQLSEPLQKLKNQLEELSVHLELDVDFAEEEIDPDYQSWQRRLKKIQEQILTLIQGWDRGKRLSHTPRIAFFGKPNAGKSSLINSLIGHQRLLVSSIAGTTRDYVEVPLNLPGGEVLLVDTAGLGKAVDELDAMAMESTKRFLKEADYKIVVIDGEKPVETDTNEFEWDLEIRTRSDSKQFVPSSGCFAVSNKSGEGIELLSNLLNRKLFPEEGSDEPLWIASKRQLLALQSASERIGAAMNSLINKPEVEIIAFEVREAVLHMREILGEIKPDDVLNKIFSGFCIGK